MRKAISTVRWGLSVQNAAFRYHMPGTPLPRHIRTGVAEKKLGRFVFVCMPRQKELIVDHLKHMHG